MLSREITYKDYFGNERTETFNFNLNKAEIIEWLSQSGDYTLDKVLLRIAEERNGKAIMDTFRDLIYRSCGKLSIDGRRFDKSEEAKNDFMETEAFSILFTEIVSDAEKATEFINGIIPKELAEEITKELEENRDALLDSVKDYVPDPNKPILMPAT